MTSEHRSPGKGRAFCQVKLRNLLDGLQTEVKFRADEQVERLSLEQVKMEYLYNDSSGHCFMNCENYEQIFLDEDLLKASIKFLLPNTLVKVEFYKEKPLINLVLKLYFLPLNLFKYLLYLKAWHYYQMMDKEIEVLKKEMNDEGKGN